jgi:hypothetical protein
MGESQRGQNIPITVRVRFFIIHIQDVLGSTNSSSWFMLNLESFSTSSSLGFSICLCESMVGNRIWEFTITIKCMVPNVEFAATVAAIMKIKENLLCVSQRRTVCSGLLRRRCGKPRCRDGLGKERHSAKQSFPFRDDFTG